MKFDPELQELFEKRIWRQNDGRKVRLSAMKDSHIQHCINGIKSGKIVTRDQWLPILEEEVKKRQLKKKVVNL